MVRSTFASERLDVMNFLNDVTIRYPRAISFAPGRPRESFFHVDDGLASIEHYVEHRSRASGTARADIVANLGQYQTTGGIVNDLVAQQLANDESIVVSPESILVTNGAQEAMLILLLALFDPATDVLLCSDPTYVGITGPATILGIEIAGVPAGPDGIDPADVEAALSRIRAAGKVPRALYDIPDFNNPLGTTMPMANRRALLELALTHDLLLIEDNPYGMFRYEGEQLPTLKALDTGQTVIYVGSFAKTVFPGLRLGVVVADQRTGAGDRPLMAELSRTKSFTSVTTAPIPQAILGGILLEHDCSLRQYVRPRLEFYRQNRDAMLRRLAEEFGRRGLDDRVTWNRPAGGFFMTVSLPFAFDAACLEQAAMDHGVVVCPMSYFALRPGLEHQVRLSFSYAEPETTREGISRFADFVSSRLR
jgi:(S)-3,5-dihydroxyphenylglycine transaminase